MAPDGCCGFRNGVATSRGHPKSPERPPQNLRFVAPAGGPKLHSGHPACGVAQGEFFPPGRGPRWADVTAAAGRLIRVQTATTRGNLAVSVLVGDILVPTTRPGCIGLPPGLAACLDAIQPKCRRRCRTAPPVPHRTWALDFMSETLYDGRRVRLRTVIDEGNREGVEIAPRPDTLHKGTFAQRSATYVFARG